MKNIISIPILRFLLLGLILTATNGCKTELETKRLPVLSTSEISNITEASAQCGGNITSDAGSDVTLRGVCWSSKPNPTIEDSKTIDAAGTGLFVSKLTGLLQNTTYFVRAYATNTDGTAYGLQITFTTKSIGLNTKPINSITINTAEGGGVIGIDGESSDVYERGLCWNTQPVPTILNNKTINGKGIGDYTSILTGLSIDTEYYVRAYATNTTGTIYGNEIKFKTQNGKINLTTNNPNEITPTSVTIEGEITSDGGSPVIERGFCISKTSNPTISNKIQNNSEVYKFSSIIKDLSQNTTYYVRAFASNSVSTAYGNEISFTTPIGIGYLESFSSNLGLFTTQSVSGNQSWNFSTLSCAAMSGYVSPTNYINEDWLISPEINLIGTITPKLTFDHVTRFFTNPTTEAVVLISLNYTSGSPTTESWDQLTPPTPFINLPNYTFVNAGVIDLSRFSKYKVRIAFKYLSTTAKAGIWEIKNFRIYE